MPQDLFDIAVVGAGPAGSVAAYAAARRGFRVALIDRQTFPRDKTCGDGIGPGAVKILRELGLGEVFDGHRPVDAVTIFGPNGSRSDSAIPDIDGEPATGYVIPRLEFDNRLFELALKAGAQDFSGTRFLETALEKAGRSVRVRDANGDHHTFNARLLVGADGAYSPVRRALVGSDAHRAEHTGFALRAYADTVGSPSGEASIVPHLMLEFSRDLLPSYGWVFPVGEGRVNIGVGGPLDVLQQRGADIRGMLDRYADSVRGRGLAIGELYERRAHHLPHVAGTPRLAHPRAVLIGDAASMINPVSGEGIAYAVATAAQLIESLEQNIEDGAELAASLAQFEKEFKRKYRLHFLSSRTTLRLLRSPTWSTMLVRSMQGDARVLSDAVGMLFGFGRFRAATAWRVVKAQL